MNDTDRYWSEGYDAGRDYRVLDRNSISYILDKIQSNLPKTCLDVGCGTGQLTRELVHRGYRCVGVDISSSAVKIAKSLTVSSDIQYLHLNYEHDPLPEQTIKEFSLITCKFVYPFIRNKNKFLNKTYNLLPTDGIFAIVTPLKKDVPLEKKDIAVDYDETLEQLKRYFLQIQIHQNGGMTYFICRK